MPQSQIPFNETASGNETFPRANRIRRRRHYLSVQKHGKRVHTANFVFAVGPHQGGSRLGITVTKRVKRAVDRNRIKRLLREVFRRNRSLFPEESDVVVIARTGAERLDYRSVREEIRRADRFLVRAAHRARAAGEQAQSPGKAGRS